MTFDDPTLPTKWLMTLCAAFAVAVLFALAHAGCMAPPPDDELEIETVGGELPEHDISGADRIEDDETDLLGLYDPDR